VEHGQPTGLPDGEPEELASDLDQFSGEAQPPEVQRRVAAAGHDQVEAVRSAPDEGRQLAQSKTVLDEAELFGILAQLAHLDLHLVSMDPLSDRALPD
jgi:hypothetical protein